MGEQYTVYARDEHEDLIEFVDRYNDVFGGESAMFIRGVKLLKKDYAEEIKALSELDDDNKEFI